jgi:hypothetical protein
MSEKLFLAWIKKEKNDLAELILSDIQEDIASLTKEGSDFYGYAIAPSHYWRSESLNLGSIINNEENLDQEDHDYELSKYSVDEWQEWTDTEFEKSNSKIQALLKEYLEKYRDEDDTLTDQFIDEIHSAVLLALKNAKSKNVFPEFVEFIVLWTLYDLYEVVFESVEALNTEEVSSRFVELLD